MENKPKWQCLCDTTYNEHSICRLNMKTNWYNTVLVNLLYSITEFANYILMYTYIIKHTHTHIQQESVEWVREKSKKVQGGKYKDVQKGKRGNGEGKDNGIGGEADTDAESDRWRG